MDDVLQFRPKKRFFHLNEFADDLVEQWYFKKYEVIDFDNRWYQDDIELEFYQDCCFAEDLSGDDIAYVLSYLGY